MKTNTFSTFMFFYLSTILNSILIRIKKPIIIVVSDEEKQLLIMQAVTETAKT